MNRSDIASQLVLIQGNKKAGLETWLRDQQVVEDDIEKIKSDIESYAEYYQ